MNLKISLFSLVLFFSIYNGPFGKFQKVTKYKETYIYWGQLGDPAACVLALLCLCCYNT